MVKVNQLGTQLTLNNADTLIDPAGNLYKLAKGQTVEFSYQNNTLLMTEIHSKQNNCLQQPLSLTVKPQNANYEYASHRSTR